jgi:arsenate reductase
VKSASTITIYYNPDCGTSRNVLGLIRNGGEDPTIIEYLKTPPSRSELQDLITRMGVPARAVLRQKGTLYDKLGLGNLDLTDNQLMDSMMAHPF